MKKQIQQHLQRGLTVLLGLFLVSGVAQSATYKENIQYEKVVPAQPTTTGDKIEVVEMFWYGCPHCNNLEPYVNRWRKKMPKDVELVRIPAVFRPSWELHARAYYTGEILGVLDKTHDAMFDAIHKLRQPMSSEKEIMDLFAQKGVKNDDFKRVFHSFAVEAKVRRAKDMSQRYGIDGVPTLIVDGKYRVTARTAGGAANIFKVVDYLVDQERKAKGH